MGLDIGTSAVRAAELSLGRGPTKLERFGQVALPPGAVIDGEVLDRDAVAAALKKLWSEAKFSSKKVVLGVANSKVVVRQVDLPWMERDELRQALAFQVQDFIPMPVSEAILDFHPVEEFTNEAGGRMLRVLLVAAGREMVLGGLAAAEKAGLRPVMVDLTSFAVIRSLAQLDTLGLDGDAEALVDIGARVTNIAVHQGGVPRFVRILLMGGRDITDAVAERLGVPAEEAESVKLSSALAAVGGQAENEPTARAVETSGSAFIEEVRGSLDYYLSSSSRAPIKRILVSGGGSQLAGLVERLSAATRLPVELAEPTAGLRIGKTGLSPDQLIQISPYSAVPVGLALGVAS